MNESFVFYKSFADAIDELPAEQYKAVMTALTKYALDGIEPDLSDPFVKALFTLMKPQVDANNKRRESGRKGGKTAQANTEQSQASDKQTQANTEQSQASDKQTQANVNVNVNVNANDKEKGDTNVSPKKKFVRPTLSEVQSFADEHGYTLDVQHFYDYYESNGWRVGRNAMKDWRAAMRNWLKNDFDRGKGQSLPDDDLNAYMAAQAAKERAEDEARRV